MATPKFLLEEVPPNSPAAYSYINKSVRVLEILAAQRIVSVTTTTPPGSPAESDLYHIPASSTGAWATHIGEFAAWINGGWTFFPVYTGMELYVIAASARRMWNGSAWV